MSPLRATLHVSTSDAEVHDDVDLLLQRLVKALGCQQVLVKQEMRMSFTSDYCGPLAIGFLWGIRDDNYVAYQCCRDFLLSIKSSDKKPNKLSVLHRSPSDLGFGEAGMSNSLTLLSH